MTRGELIRIFALDSFCDDYEDIEQIMKYMDKQGLECGMTISHAEVIQALREVIELGWAKAWDLTQPKREPTKEYQGMPTPEEIAAFDPWFFRTQEGLAFSKPLSSDGLFDENNTLREDWIALAASVERDEFVRLFALDSARDHYMTIGHIEKRRDALARRCGIKISRDEIIQALGELIELGYAKAWQLDRGDPPREYEGMPPLEDIKPYQAYFYLTPEGMVVELAHCPGWPFDDNGNLREDWVAPNA